MTEQLLTHSRQQQIVDHVIANTNDGVLNWHHQQIIAQEASIAFGDASETAKKQATPTAVYQPTLSKDGNQWCFLLGDNLQIGCAGFGDTPALAAIAFDKAFNGEPREGE